MASLLQLIHRNWQIAHPPELPKAENALRFAILGAANIAPAALIRPAKSHPEVIIQAVAARNKKKAIAYAKQHGIPQVLDSYEAILDDPSIDAVYIPLPNGLHYEWTLKALAKGKHVLLEKPAVSNAEEAAALFRSPLVTQPNAPVLLEAFHYRFQPGWQYFLTLIDRPNLEHVYSVTKVPWIAFDKNDIRFKYELAGGAMMDLDTYQMSVLRQVCGAEPEECVECTVRKCAPPNELCDAAAKATFRFPGGVVGEAEADLQGSLLDLPLPRTIVRHKPVLVPDSSLPDGQEKLRTRRLVFENYMLTAYWHRIDIEDEFVVRRVDGDRAVLKRWKTKESKKVYTFKDAGVDQPSEPYWPSYRHQLEQFVNRVRGRPGSGVWVDAEDSVAQAQMIDMAYGKSELPLRPSSNFVLPAEGA